LENLERERALTVMEMIDGKLSAEERWQRLSAAKRRLADLERIVLNDKKLRSKTSNLVKRSFQSFELTFLAHASVENQSSIQGHWFDQVGMSTDDLMSTRVSK
jgi:glutaminase